MNKTWFITGSSRGLGRSLTEAALAAGDSVAATARNIDDLKVLVDWYADQIYPINLDVNNNAGIREALKNTAARFGSIDILVNNAGFGITGAAEAFTEEQVSSQLATNLYAPISITRAVLPYMRRQGHGRILQISSIGGRRGSGGVSIYQAAKFGISGFTEALNEEVRPLNIFVTAIEPGGLRTDWGGSSMTFAPRVEGYENTVDKRAGFFRSGEFVPVGDPDKAASVMLSLADHPNPPIHLVLGSDAIGLLKDADKKRSDQMEEWMTVSLSTDHNAAENFLETEYGKAWLKGNK